MDDTLAAQLTALLLSQTRFPSHVITITKLMGEASYREYFRVTLEDNQTLILMKMPPGAASVAEEITKATQTFDEIPFINIQKYLRSLELPVAKIIASSPENGLLLLEDLGDESLEKKLQFTLREPQGVLLDKLSLPSLYKKALELLVALQEETRRHPSQDCIAFFRKFDEDLLFWEWNHFLEYGLEDRLKIKLPENEKRIYCEIGREVCKKIAQMPTGFTHRDFQSRNLMFYGDDFYLIDFQDALTGPVVYDLVGLLRDSYIELKENVLTKLQETYLDLLDPMHPYYKKKEEFVRHFDLMTLQRKLKDTGRFQYIHTVKKNSSFLKHVPASVSYVKRALERMGTYPELEKILKKYSPEYKY